MLIKNALNVGFDQEGTTLDSQFNGEGEFILLSDEQIFRVLADNAGYTSVIDSSGHSAIVFMLSNSDSVPFAGTSEYSHITRGRGTLASSQVFTSFSLISARDRTA